MKLHKCHTFLGSTRRVCQGFAKTCKCSYIWSVWCSMSRMGHRRLSKIPRSTLQGKLLNTVLIKTGVRPKDKRVQVSLILVFIYYLRGAVRFQFAGHQANIIRNAPCYVKIIRLRLNLVHLISVRNATPHHDMFSQLVQQKPRISKAGSGLEKGSTYKMG